MQKSRSKPETADEAEATFYEAFKRCDIDMMAELWAEGEVVCIHPGSGPIVGYDAVIRSWQQIFDNALPPQITITPIKQMNSSELAVRLVLEEIETDGGDIAAVLATNIYQKLENGWRMVEHHGSVTRSMPQKRTLQ